MQTLKNGIIDDFAGCGALLNADGRRECDVVEIVDESKRLNWTAVRFNESDEQPKVRKNLRRSLET